MDGQRLRDFKKTIWDHYAAQGRLFDWRNVDDPYRVFISEVMLQQTQTQRVAQKYPLFISLFPDFQSLANASLKDVLSAWQGLGYNRRGMYLHRAAQIITNEHNGILPDNPEILMQLPGIGKATASSIVAFAFNKPTIFIETNIRAVFIHFFFEGHDKVDDADLIPLVQATVDHKDPCQWYYALMDYGVMLKKTVINPSRKSKHYHKQSKFEGSDRQIRGAILRALTRSKHPIAKEILYQLIPADHARIDTISAQLIKEKFINYEGFHFSIAEST